MNDKKFYGLGIVLGAITFGLSFFAFSAESLVLGVVSLIMNLKKRHEHRILIGMLLTILGMVSSVLFLAFMMYIGATGAGDFDYWLFQLIF